MVASAPVSRDPIDGLVNQLVSLQRQIDELTRRSATSFVAPICRVKLASDLSLAGSSDTYAQDGWAAGEDPDNIFTVGRGPGIYSSITVPMSGRYLVYIRGVFNSAASASSMAAYVTVNGVGGSYSKVRGVGDGTTYGGDGTIIHGIRSVFLNQGDLLYWGFWSYAACTLAANTFNVPTEVSITYLGSR